MKGFVLITAIILSILTITKCHDIPEKLIAQSILPML